MRVCAGGGGAHLCHAVFDTTHDDGHERVGAGSELAAGAVPGAIPLKACKPTNPAV